MIAAGSKVIVYAGKNYGRVHDVVSVFGNMLVCRCGYDSLTVHRCDVEHVESPAKVELKKEAA